MAFKSTGPIDSEIKRITAPVPPPAVVESEFVGDIIFENEYPTQETAQKLFDQMDFQSLQ